MVDESEMPQAFSLTDVWRFFKVPIVLGLVSLLCIALSVTIYIKSYQSNTPIQFSVPTEGLDGESSSSATMITVDVEGAVNNPGVYMLPAASRVEDAIVQAKGLARNADLQGIAAHINRAAKLVDGAKLYIPTVDVSQDMDLSNVDDASQQSILNINTASQAQLEMLSGVGPVTAKKIIDNRPYQVLEDLIGKKVMGQAVFEKIKNRLGI